MKVVCCSDFMNMIALPLWIASNRRCVLQFTGAARQQM